ncbi:MAG: hypothetical protein ACYDIA_07025 [Candidatus Humimicrobiaceae bacterium]
MKDVNTISGIHTVRTMNSTKKRSIPRIQSSTYLDLYMLNKEKERLLKEAERLDLRNAVIKKRLEEISLEMYKLQDAETVSEAGEGKINPSGRTFNQKKEVKKEWKKMPLNY